MSAQPQWCVAPLFVPGDRPDRFNKAASSGADAVIIDWEDAVAPERKTVARHAIGDELPEAVPVMIRINGRGTPWHEDDVAALRFACVAGVMVPKVESPQHIQSLRQVLGSEIQIVALIESARGLASVRDIVAAGAARLAFGSLDFCVDLGCAHTREALLSARSELVLSSRLGHLPGPLDGVTVRIDDVAEAESDARYAAELGFAGKLCIHPRQVMPVLRGFAPTPEERAWAAKVLSLASDSALSVDGMMVDAPVRQRAESVVARALLWCRGEK